MSGFNTKWHLEKCWSLYGNMTLSGLWSQFENRRYDTETFQDGVYTVFKTTDTFHTIKATFEGELGLQVNWTFQDNRYRVLLQGGWETQIWINHNHFITRSWTQNDLGDFITQGYNLKFRFDF